ncbi:MAG: hypothetical protein QXH37_07010 [Candidatus Bathyarchaeia archaeon]
MGTKTISYIIAFAALAIALNLYGPNIPAPYMQTFSYTLWEIPIVTVFLLCGAKVGCLAALISASVPFAISQENPMPSILYFLIATVSMLLGISIAKFYAIKNSIRNNLALILLFTAFGAIFRTLVMVLLYRTFIGVPPPLGYSLPETAVTSLIVSRVFFDTSLALYTIPAGYLFTLILKPFCRKFKPSQKISSKPQGQILRL